MTRSYFQNKIEITGKESPEDEVMVFLNNKTSRPNL